MHRSRLSIIGFPFGRFGLHCRYFDSVALPFRVLAVFRDTLGQYFTLAYPSLTPTHSTILLRAFAHHREGEPRNDRRSQAHDLANRLLRRWRRV